MAEQSLREQDRAESIARLEAIQSIQGEMGWRWFIAEIESEIEVLRDQIMVARDENEIGRLQGRFEAFTQIRYFEDTVDSMLASLREGPDDADV